MRVDDSVMEAMEKMSCSSKTVRILLQSKGFITCTKEFFLQVELKVRLEGGDLNGYLLIKLTC